MVITDIVITAGSNRSLNVIDMNTCKEVWSKDDAHSTQHVHWITQNKVQIIFFKFYSFNYFILLIRDRKLVGVSLSHMIFLPRQQLEVVLNSGT